MKVENLSNKSYLSYGQAVRLSDEGSENKPTTTNPLISSDTVSFKRGSGNFSKKFFHIFRKLSHYMKDPSEMTNAVIAAIGTGAIAPFAIMCSPAKKTGDVQDPKVEKEKKRFQALRQPVSAALAFGFQVPTTIGIAALFNKGAYEKHWGIFEDKGEKGIKELGDLIPDKKYLAKQAKKALKDNSSEELKSQWAQELAKIADKDKIKQELIEQLRNEDIEEGFTRTQQELEKEASKPKRMKKFLSEKMAKLRHDRLIDEKVQELASENRVFKDIDLVTEDYQNLARERFKSDFNTLRENANLSKFDKFLEAMGFQNSKLKALEDAEKALAKEKGLSIMKAEASTNQELEKVFKGDKLARLKKYVENRDIKSQKLFDNKKFWITLCTNLIMVAISCIALNWIHPKFANMVDKIKARKEDRRNQDDKKVEVNA